MKQKISVSNIRGQLTRSEMKKLSGGGGYCVSIRSCDMFNPCGSGYCACYSGLCMTRQNSQQT